MNRASRWVLTLGCTAAILLAAFPPFYTTLVVQDDGASHWRWRLTHHFADGHRPFWEHLFGYHDDWRYLRWLERRVDGDRMGVYLTFIAAATGLGLSWTLGRKA